MSAHRERCRKMPAYLKIVVSLERAKRGSFFFFFKCIFLFFIIYLYIYFFLLYNMVIQLHLHVYILFSHTTCSIISDQAEFPGLHSRIPLLIHPKGNILHLFTPRSQSLSIPLFLDIQVASMSYKQCCNEHWGTCIFSNYGFLRRDAQEWHFWIIWQFYIQVFREPPYYTRLHSHQQWLYYLTFPPTVQEGSLFSISSLAFIVCRLFDDGPSDSYEVIPCCSFDWHFSNNQWW